MNHQKIHNQIILKARLEHRSKTDGIYYENHHINPRCMGGSNDPTNLILLTAREHFIIHYLLAKMYGGKLWYAFRCMGNGMDKSGNRYFNSRLYELCKGKIEVTDETKRKISEGMKGKNKGKIFTDEHKKNLSEARKGKKRSDETRSKMSEGMKGKNKGKTAWNKGKPMSDEHKKNLSEARKGKKPSDESRSKMSEAKKGKKLTDETKQNMKLAQQKRREREKNMKKNANV